MKELETRYLERLSDLYPTIAAASTEIINLQAILNLPKGTEHFLTDIHGEWEAFSHVLKNGSGAVRSKIEDVFGYTLGKREKQELATLIYYPKEKTEQVKRTEKHMEDWYKIQLYRLIEVSKRAASKYTRSKVRKALPKDFAYVIEELITEKAELHDKESYYNEIIQTIIRIGRAEEFICAIADLIQRLVIDHLHIVGDIYDRGPGPHIIMDKLMTYHSVDIQWGNHDVLWMGCGSRAKRLHCQCDPDLCPLWESGYSGGWIRDQSSASGEFCTSHLWGRPLYLFQAQRKRTPAKGGDGDESSDAQGNFRDTV